METYSTICRVVLILTFRFVRYLAAGLIAMVPKLPREFVQDEKLPTILYHLAAEQPKLYGEVSGIKNWFSSCQGESVKPNRNGGNAPVCYRQIRN